MRQIRMLVSGRVQGVFFRANTQKKAASLAVKGYAKNLDDGNVEIVAEGTEDALQQLLDFCRKGPPGSEVSNVSITYEDAAGEFEDFRIL